MSRSTGENISAASPSPGRPATMCMTPGPDGDDKMGDQPEKKHWFLVG